MSDGHGFKVWNLLHNEYINQNSHIAAACVGAVALVGAAVAYRALVPKLAIESADDAAFVPPSNLGIRNLFELPGEFIQGLAKEIIGHHYAEYLPVLLFIFIWTLANNLLGMVPGFGSTTDNLNTTLAMGFSVFVYYNIQGVRSHGIKYLEQFAGHLQGLLLLFLGPAMFVIELISHSVRPLTLGIRLRTNIYADHSVHSIITGLINDFAHGLGEKYGALGSFFGGLMASLAPVPIMFLGALVCVIQAFVFTLLTMVYVSMATAHEEH